MDNCRNEKLAAALIGRRLSPAYMPEIHHAGPMFSLWGEDAGIPAGDVHFHRAYRIYVRYDADLTITGARVVVEGELLSPCSGYAMEALDQFDYPAILEWCLRHTLEGKEHG